MEMGVVGTSRWASRRAEREVMDRFSLAVMRSIHMVREREVGGHWKRGVLTAECWREGRVDRSATR